MSENDELDLSPLDPLEDPDHWRDVVSATRQRVDAVLAGRADDPLAAIVEWRRPLLIAAAAAVALLVPVELYLETREPRAEQVERLVALSSSGAVEGDPPSGAEFLRALAAEEQP
jgi:hypothetical protein